MAVQLGLQLVDHRDRLLERSLRLGKQFLGDAWRIQVRFQRGCPGLEAVDDAMQSLAGPAIAAAAAPAAAPKWPARIANVSTAAIVAAMKSPAPSAPAPDQCSAARRHPWPAAIDTSVSASRTVVNTLAGSPDAPGPTSDCTSRIGAASAATRALRIG